jgi:enamine deaminase RidA (YjgF/YER057c/UK114 family)
MEIIYIEVNMKKIVVSDKAPKAIGPYSVAVQTGQMVYTAGQMGRSFLGNCAGKC